jgi:eukaryotic-like serine/threonine-protein kinase
MQFWNELEGQTIDGLYPLRRLVRSEGRSAWFETETFEPQHTPSTISLTEALTDADEVTARLEAAQHLVHPNLVTITKVGQVKVDNTLLVYALMEPIEQSLSDVLQSQTLSPEEGREVAESLVGALTAIHQKGMSHGRVEAASVLATEDTVKLRSDCLHRTAAGQAEDVAGVGTTLFHAFTQRKVFSATDAQINRVPAPFAEIIRNASAGRWTLAQISNALKPVLPVASAVPPVATTVPPVAPVPSPAARPAPAAPTPSPTPRPAPGPAQRPAPAPAPVAPRPPSEPVAAKVPVKAAPIAERLTAPPLPRVKPLDIEDEDEPVAKRPPFLLYGALAVVVLAIIGWLLLRPHSEPAPATATNSQTAAPVVAPEPTVAEKPPTAKPPAAKPTATRPSAAKPAGAKPAPSSANDAETPGPDRSIWRVVAYTYKGQTKAEDMVAEINGKHADLGAEVFSPPRHGGDYLVTVGGAMDRAEATKMLDKARRLGLPADSYVQNFSK